MVPNGAARLTARLEAVLAPLPILPLADGVDVQSNERTSGVVMSGFVEQAAMEDWLGVFLTSHFRPVDSSPRSSTS